VLPEHVELDPDARRGLVELDRRGLEGCARWPEETVLSVGDVQLMVGPVPDADAVVTPTAGAPSVDFNRPPRLARPERPTVFTLPREPRDMRRPPFSPVMLLAPVVMGGVMFFVTHRVASLVFLAFSPIMMIANRLAGRANSKKMFRQAMARYEQQKHDAETAAFKALVAERGLRRRDHPDPAEVMLRATGPRAGLWERRVSDGDWLDLRVGTADVPSEVELSVPERASYEEPLRWTAPDVPVSVPLGTLGVIGVWFGWSVFEVLVRLQGKRYVKDGPWWRKTYRHANVMDMISYVSFKNLLIGAALFWLLTRSGALVL